MVEDDFKVMARLLSAIRANEEKPVFNPLIVDEKVLGTTAEHRDSLAIKLQKAGYIEGIFILDGIDNMPRPVVLWGNSHPSITIAGLEFIQTSEPLRKAGKAIIDAGIAVASQTISATITQLFNS